MAKVMATDEIKTERLLRSSITELAKSIQNQGMLRPILVNSSGKLLDGLRRLEAARSIGLTEVPVVISDDYSKTMAEIAKTREHGILAVQADHYRLADAYFDTLSQMQTRLSRTQMSRFGLAPGSKLTQQQVPARRLFATSFGITNHATQGAIFLARTINDPGSPYYKYGLQILQMLDTGDLQISNVMPALHRLIKKDDPRLIKDVSTQRTILNNAVNSMTAAIAALSQILELSHDLRTEELLSLQTQFSRVRGNLQKLNNQFKKELSNR